MRLLDARVRRAAVDWRLTIGDALTGGTSSTVFGVRDSTGRDLVLKLPAAQAGTGDLTAAEAAALTAWATTGVAVTLVDATSDALLLVRARPGVGWTWMPSESLDERATTAADLLARLWSQTPGTYRFPTLQDVYPEQERVAHAGAAYEQGVSGEPDRGVPGLVRLPAAKPVAERLMSTARNQCLLHGDFITKNLVSDAESPVGSVALDPLPMIGDPAAEAAAFAAYHPAELILPLADALGRELDLDVRRTLTWAAIWAVHQAAQAWRDDQVQLEHLVSSRTLKDLLAG